MFKAFSDPPSSSALEHLFDSNSQDDGKGKRIEGSRLISLMLKVGDSVFVGKNLRTYLSREAGVNVNEIDTTLVSMKEVRQLSPQIFYVKKEELPKVVHGIRKAVYPEIKNWGEYIDLKEKEIPKEPARDSKINQEGFYISVRGHRVVDVVKKDRGIELLLQDEPTTSNASPTTKDRFSVSELAELAGVSVFTIRSKLKKYEGKFDVQRKTEGTGRAYEVRLTQDNFSLLGIPEEKAREIIVFKDYNLTTDDRPEASILEQVKVSKKSEQLSPPPLPVPIAPPITPRSRSKDNNPSEPAASIEISGHIYDITPSRGYTPAEVLDFLKLVHPSFSEITVNRIFTDLKLKEYMEGRELIRYIGRVNGMMVLSSSSTRQRLENMDIPIKIFETPEFSEYVHKAPGLREDYVLRQELESIKTKLANFRSGATNIVDLDKETDLTLGKTITDCRKKLSDKGLMPRGSLLEKLLESGVIVEKTLVSVEETYSRFQTEMEGWTYFNFNSVKEELAPHIGWRDFKDHYMKVLEEKGIAKEIVSACGGNSRCWVYVLKKGTPTHEIFSALKNTNN